MNQNKYIISETYEVEPLSIKYDTEFSKFNPEKSEKEYGTLLAQIKENGQIDPGFMKNGLLGDGVHRAKACTELGIKMKVVDIDPNITREEYILLCNKNTFASRNDSATQLAIKGLALVEKFGFSTAKATQMTGLKDRRAISYASAIKLSKYNDKLNILETLLKGEPININGKITKSLEVAKRLIAKLEEEELMDKEIISKSNTEIDYNEMIKTEVGKEMFWNVWKEKDLHAGIELVNTVNIVTEQAAEIKRLKQLLGEA